jgi:hypothetical protein
MSKSNHYEEALLRLIFQGVAVHGLDALLTKGAADTIWVALHTADPGEEGVQINSEVAYGGYARVGVVRSAAGWVVEGNSVRPANNVEFPEMVSGNPGTATHASIGISNDPTGIILYRGALTPPISLNLGSVPRLRSTSSITED